MGKLSINKTLLLIFGITYLISFLHFLLKGYAVSSLLFFTSLGYAIPFFLLAFIIGGLLSFFMKSNKSIAFWMGFIVALAIIALSTYFSGF